MENRTWLQAIEYLEQHEPYSAQVLSTMRQHFTEPYGFKVAGKRATNQELDAFLIWAAHSPLPYMTREKWLEKVPSDMTTTQQRTTRCYLLKFISALEGMGHLVVLTPPDSPPVSKQKGKKKGIKPRSRRHPDWAHKPLDDDSRQALKQLSNEELSLKFTPEFYLPFYRNLYPGLTDPELLLLIGKELDRIKEELKGFRSYLGSRSKDRQRFPTQDLNVGLIEMLLGWLFKQTQDLAKVSITQLVPVVNVKISQHEYPDPMEYFVQKGRLEAESEAVAEYIVDFILDYFDTYNPDYSKNSKKLYINAVLNLAKYLYQKITRRAKYSNFQDIPVITALRLLRSNLPDDPPKTKKIPVTLDVLIQSLEYFKVDLDYPYNESLSNGYFIRVKRDFRCIAHDMQRFLMFCLLVIVHPLRRRSLAELQWGKTLLKGFKTKSNTFIPVEKMEDPSKALYYFNMLPKEYKTGDHYGPYCVHLPNYRFQDGTCFYDYLEKYLFGGYRQALLRHGQDHQYLFVQINERQGCHNKAGDPISYDSYSEVVNGFAKKLTGVAISPRKFRTIYRTYYVNLGASPVVLDGLAYCMQHSPETAAKDYTWQTLDEKVGPFVAFFENHFG